MKTRTGKIARLPKEIRDELNHRIENGLSGKHLVAWLNTLPEVQKVLAEQFGGRPLNQQNLSEWKHGGYAEWEATRDGRNYWSEMLEHARQLNEKITGADGADASGHLRTFLVVELAEAMDKFSRIEDSNERWKILRMLIRSLSSLRSDDCREKRLHLWDRREARRYGQIKADQTESASKNIFFSGQAHGSAGVPPAS